MRIFTLLTDPAVHPLIDGSGSVFAVQPGGPLRPALRIRFGVNMMVRAWYKILSAIVEYEPDRLIPARLRVPGAGCSSRPRTARPR